MKTLELGVLKPLMACGLVGAKFQFVGAKFQFV